MGLFSALLKSDKVATTDKVWKTKDWAVKGMATEALWSITEKEVPLVICFFPATLQRVIEFFGATGVPYFKLEAGANPDTRQQTVFVTETSYAVSHEGSRFISACAKSSALSILFAGHFPLPKVESDIISKLTAGLGVKPRIAFCLSLEDPLLRAFGSERLGPLLETLGWKDEECIEHSMVSKSILNAQRKLEKNIRHEKPAASEEEWFEKNHKVV